MALPDGYEEVEVTAPDGSVVVVEVPVGTSDEQIFDFVRQSMGPTEPVEAQTPEIASPTASVPTSQNAFAFAGGGPTTRTDPFSGRAQPLQATGDQRTAHSRLFGDRPISEQIATGAELGFSDTSLGNVGVRQANYGQLLRGLSERGYNPADYARVGGPAMGPVTSAQIEGSYGGGAYDYGRVFRDAAFEGLIPGLPSAQDAYNRNVEVARNALLQDLPYDQYVAQGGVTSQEVYDYWRDRVREEGTTDYVRMADFTNDEQAREAYVSQINNFRQAYDEGIFSNYGEYIRALQEQAQSDGTIPSFAGQLLGSIPDPLNAAGGGQGVVRGALSNMGAEIALSPVINQNRRERGQEEMTLGEQALNVGLAGAIGGAIEVPGAIASRRATTAPDVSIETTPTLSSLEQDAQAFINRPQEPASALEQEAQAFANRPRSNEPTQETLWPTEETLRQREQQLEENLAREVEAWRNREVVSEPLPDVTQNPEISDARVNEVVTEINRITEDWRGIEEGSIQVVRSVSDIPDPAVRERAVRDEAAGARGIAADNGTVYIVSDNLTRPEDVQAVVFHETLGHRGLSKVFQQSLDDTLSDIYNTNTLFRNRANAWMRNNPGAYAESPNRVARAMDEVLAEMSEQGPLKASVLDVLKNKFKAWLRRMGMQGVDFSDREVMTILAMAHDAVINGRAGDVRGNGFRYSVTSLHDKKIKKFERLLSSRNPSLTDISDAIDYLDEAYAQGLDVGELQDRLIALEESVYASKTFSNDNVPETDQQRYTRQYEEAFREEERLWSDPRWDKDRRTKERKAVEKEFDEATKKKDYFASLAYPAPENKYSDTTRQKVSLTSEKMLTARNINEVDQVLKEMADLLEEDGGSPKWTLPEIERAADDLGLTASKYMKGKDLDSLASYVRAAHLLMTNTVDDVVRLKERADREGWTPTNRMNVAQKLATLRAIYARFDVDSAGVGRALRVLREVSESKASVRDALKYMDDTHATVGAVPDEQLMRVVDALARTESPARGAQAVQKAMGNHWEDYVGSLYYNAMLSSPVTWFKNFFGTPMNFVTDLVVDSTASAVTKFLPVQERITSREIAARITAPLSAFLNYRTYKNVAEAFASGRTSMPGFERKVSQRGPVYSTENAKSVAGKAAQGVGVLSETPTRIMAATDEIWSNVFFISNLQGAIIRRASNEFSDSAIANAKILEWSKDPPRDIIEEAVGVTNRQLFRDIPSGPAAALLKLQTPRHQDEIDVTLGTDPVTGKQKALAYNVRKKDGQVVRAAKFATGLLVPFVPTLDSIARTVIRNSGPVALFSGDIRRQLMQGGIERQSAMARMAVSSATLAFFSSLAAQDLITGIEEGDPQESKARGAVRPPMSIRFGDEWVSYAGFDPVAGQIAAAATAAQRYKNDSSYPIVDTVQALAVGMAGSLAQSSYAEGLSNFMEAILEGYSTAKEGGEAGPIVRNAAVNTVSTPLSPNFARWLNQEFFDPQQRDQRGNGTFSGRLSSRIQSAWPGMSQDLPQVYDVFGRPTQNLRQERLVETDPTVLEVNRLEREHDRLVMGPPSRYVEIDGEQRQLTGAEFQQYQQMTGSRALEEIRFYVESPSWRTLPDEEKINQIKGVLEMVRREARIELFGQEP